MFNPKKDVLFLRNHKCASSTCQKILEKHFPIKGGERGKEMPWIHADANSWKKYIEEKKLKGKYLITLTTVRNPWDRMVSLFFYEGYHSKTYGKDGFKNFIKTVKYHTFPNFIFDKNGNRMVDIVIKIEELDNLFEIISKLLEIKLNKKDLNIKLNSSSRPNKTYREYYDDETKKIVQEMFKYEIEYFSYIF